MGSVPVCGASQRAFDARTMDDEEVEAAQGSEFRFTDLLSHKFLCRQRKVPGCPCLRPGFPRGRNDADTSRAELASPVVSPRPLATLPCSALTVPCSALRCTVGAMSFKASKALMELRVHLCQSSAASKGVRCARVKNFPNSVVCPALE